MKNTNTAIKRSSSGSRTVVIVKWSGKSPFDSLVLSDYVDEDNCRFVFPYRDGLKDPIFMGELTIPKRYVHGVKDRYGRLAEATSVSLSNKDDVSYDVKLYRKVDLAAPVNPTCDKNNREVCTNLRPVLDENGHKVSVSLTAKDIVRSLEDAEKGEYDKVIDNMIIDRLLSKCNDMVNDNDHQWQLGE